MMHRHFRLREFAAEPRQFEKLVCLSVADRVLHSDIYSGNGKYRKKTGVFPMAARNAGIVGAFPALFEGLGSSGTGEDRVMEEITGWIDRSPAEGLLHMPGQIHESLMAGMPGSGGKQTARKRQGSYYTPAYVVRHMVRLAFDLVSHDSDVNEYEGFRALDPACGGACFLLELYNHLAACGWEPARAMEALFGVDIDDAAVELSIFVLTLAVLDKCPWMKPREIKARLQAQIKAGNALAALKISQLPDTVEKSSRFFSWEKEFPAVFARNAGEKDRGFDLVLGNPPYVSNKLIPAGEKKYYCEHYLSAEGQFDLAVPFLEQGINLLKEGGVLCYITSNKFMGSDYGKSIRKLLLENHTVCDLTDVSTLKTFAGTAAYPVIMTVRKGQAPARSPVKIMRLSQWQDLSTTEPTGVEQAFFREIDGYLLTTMLDHRTMPIIKKIQSIEGRIPRGIIKCGLAETGFNRWVMRNNSQKVFNGREKYLAPFIQAGHIKPYRTARADLIDERYIHPAKVNDMRETKIVIPGIARTLAAAVDRAGCLLGRVYYIKESDTSLNLEYLTVLLNSKVLNFYYKVMYWPVHLEGGYLRFNSGYLANLPVYLSTCQGSGQARTAGRLAEPGSILTEPGSVLAKLGSILAKLPPDDAQAVEAACRADAIVFALYGVNEREAAVIMDFLGTEPQERDMILEFIGDENGF